MAVSAGDAYLDIGPRLASNFGRQLTSQVQAPISKVGEEASKHFGRSFAHGVGTAAKGIPWVEVVSPDLDPRVRTGTSSIGQLLAGQPWDVS